MTLDEARAWLRGERSHRNDIQTFASDAAQSITLTALADAGSTWQALAIVAAAQYGLETP